MEDVNLSVVLTFVQAIMVVLIPAYFVWQQKRTEGKTAVDVAKVQNEDDVVTAYTAVQAQLFQAQQSLIEPLNKRIAQQQERLTVANEEIEQLRDFVHKQSNKIDALEKENKRLRQQVIDLTERAKASDERATQLQKRIDYIKGELDTGKLNLPE